MACSGWEVFGTLVLAYVLCSRLNRGFIVAMICRFELVHQNFVGASIDCARTTSSYWGIGKPAYDMAISRSHNFLVTYSIRGLRHFGMCFVHALIVVSLLLWSADSNWYTRILRELKTGIWYDHTTPPQISRKFYQWRILAFWPLPICFIHAPIGVA